MDVGDSVRHRVSGTTGRIARVQSESYLVDQDDGTSDVWAHENVLLAGAARGEPRVASALQRALADDATV